MYKTHKICSLILNISIAVQILRLILLKINLVFPAISNKFFLKNHTFYIDLEKIVNDLYIQIYVLIIVIMCVVAMLLSIFSKNNLSALEESHIIRTLFPSIIQLSLLQTINFNIRVRQLAYLDRNFEVMSYHSIDVYSVAIKFFIASMISLILMVWSVTVITNNLYNRGCDD